MRVDCIWVMLVKECEWPLSRKKEKYLRWSQIWAISKDHCGDPSFCLSHIFKHSNSDHLSKYTECVTDLD